jgi:hypothetical protein
VGSGERKSRLGVSGFAGGDLRRTWDDKLVLRVWRDCGDSFFVRGRRSEEAAAPATAIFGGMVCAPLSELVGERLEGFVFFVRGLSLVLLSPNIEWLWTGLGGGINSCGGVPVPTDPPALRSELIAARPVFFVGGNGGAGAENIQKSCTLERLLRHIEVIRVNPWLSIPWRSSSMCVKESVSKVDCLKT